MKPLQKITDKIEQHMDQYAKSKNGGYPLSWVVKEAVLEGVKLAQRRTRLKKEKNYGYGGDFEKGVRQGYINCQHEQQARFKKLIKEID